jgi:hypothetical protein
MEEFIILLSASLVGIFTFGLLALYFLQDQSQDEKDALNHY